MCLSVEYYFIDPGYVAIDMNGDADQVPSYNEVTGTPKQDRITGPNNDTAAAIPTAPPASAYELPPPPTYEQVCKLVRFDLSSHVFFH